MQKFANILEDSITYLINKVIAEEMFLSGRSERLSKLLLTNLSITKIR